MMYCTAEAEVRSSDGLFDGHFAFGDVHVSLYRSYCISL